MPIGPLIPKYQTPNIESEPVDVDVIELELNTSFEENVPTQEGIIHELYERPEKEYPQESSELLAQVDTKKIRQRYYFKQADLDKIWKTFEMFKI